MVSSLTLASGSDYKRKLLDRLGLEFETHAAAIDESAPPDEPVKRTAKRLAGEKATQVARERPNTYVLGADQTIGLDGDRLSKPKTVERAVEQLGRLAGRTHDLFCAISLLSPDGGHREACLHFEMVMRPFSESEARDYVEEERPLECAGSYRIEAGGIRLFRAMRGDDYTAIVGLPLTRVRKLLEASGYFSNDR